MEPRHLKWVEIDRSALANNLECVRRMLAPRVQLMAVVKADGYGHGAAEVGRLALAQGASCLGVLTVEEAQALRGNGVKGRIVVLAPPLPHEAPAAVAARVETTIDSLELARALSKAARTPVPVHVDLDYGLGRWGLPPKALPDLLAKLRGLRLRLAGLSAHLDYVPGKNAVEAEEKLRDFSRLAARIRPEHPGLVCHGANSSILLDFPHWQLDMVRVGNLIYGINRSSKELPLRPPWQLNARIVALKKVAKGRPIGYGSEYLAPRKMTVATLPVGYSDGLTMEPAERLIRLGHGFRYYGKLRGVKAPFVGRCGIAHVLVDVSAVPNARLGEVVALPVRRTAANLRIPRIYR
jgi:alanine racemase